MTITAYDKVAMRIAKLSAQLSRDLSTKVGAFLETRSGEKYKSCNNINPPVLETPERQERPAKYLYTSHAEENIIVAAARKELYGSTMYMTHFCCAACARMIIGVGIKRVVVDDGVTHMPPEQFSAAESMLREAGVEICRVTKEA